MEDLFMTKKSGLFDVKISISKKIGMLKLIPRKSHIIYGFLFTSKHRQYSIFYGIFFFYMIILYHDMRKKN